MGDTQIISTAVPERSSRHFLSAGTDFNSWDSLKPFYDNLQSRTFQSLGDLQMWLQNLSELDAAISEHLGWLYIKMTCNTQDKISYTFSSSAFTKEASSLMYGSEKSNLIPAVLYTSGMDRVEPKLNASLYLLMASSGSFL